MSKNFSAKAIIAVLCVILMTAAALPCYAAVVTDGENFSTFGDANSDGVVDIRDFVRVKRHLADSSVEIAALAADLDGNGSVGADDTVRFAKVLLTLDEAFTTGGNSWSGIY